MKINKTVKKAAFISLGTFLLLFVILVAHIATAKPIDNATLQVSRIDFNKPLDAARIREIHRNLKSIPGVRTDHFDAGKGVLVYFHDNRIADSKTIYTALMHKGNYKAERFVLPAGVTSKKVCPIMKQDGFSYKFSRFIQKIFN
jgi:hypothetical protein